MKKLEIPFLYLYLNSISQYPFHICSVMVAERLDEDEKGVSQIDTLGGPQEMTIINESGLYAVILRSDKPEAKPFRKWVTKEVLPSIRKTGSYRVPTKPIPLMAKRTITKVKETRAEMEALGENPTKILKTLKDICNRAGYNPPALVLDPGAMTMDDWEDMLDFAYTHKGEVTTYEDYLAYLLLPRLES